MVDVAMEDASPEDGAVGGSPQNAPTPKATIRKLTACKQCANCVRADCGECTNCLDKPKFGGPGARKRPCIMRKCLSLMPDGSSDVQTAEAGGERTQSDGLGKAIAGKAAGHAPSTRSTACRTCANCTRDECGTCKNCVDKPKFGGPGTRKQPCIMRKCLTPAPVSLWPEAWAPARKRRKCERERAWQPRRLPRS